MSSTSAPEVVRRYAAALLEAATETGVADAVARDLEGLQSSLIKSSELQEFLSNRLVDGAAAAKALAAIFAGKVDGLTLNFLQMVAQRRRANLLGAIVDTALRLLEERAGVATAQVRCATELSGDQIDRLQQRLSAHTGSRVQVEVEVDPGLRGGIVARIGDKVFDGSVETQLARLHRRLVGAPSAS
ncbi:MAG TPA: ATP synthase F1 subunit delta [Candidatus Latescibacteria bacterium]|jgi:F-type H+-transporting ATPase subunit delta|nr:ATP synthase F1 subunit delta [Candidatus Latescibacterota bacterium]|tara:strand:- start:2380 stop:2940 length:561 start_codon:yes stop_codon:yes gene_type:complete